jgi:UDPglucose 6-dehydrogenase
VLGLAFKGGTDDIRESPAMDLVEMLLAEGCAVAAYDPAAMKRAELELPASAQLRYAASVDDAVKDADALLILTDWEQFARLDLDRLYAALRYPIVIDGRNLYDPRTMMQHGFTYMSIGRAATTPEHEPATVVA